jgi:maltooligosyltrehalose trehalohydrolase
MEEAPSPDMPRPWRLKYGATPNRAGGVEFRVWAPNLHTLAVKIGGRTVPMDRDGEDFQVLIADARPGQTYSLIVDGARERPDPVSRSQPEGVHGPSQITDTNAFRWEDHGWKGLPLEQYIFYELHTGTFTPEGTFEGVIGRIPYLKDLGVTAIELMPVAEFPGDRNWGYDGVDLYAPHSAYGGPDRLKELVNACHRAGLAVVLDVVYNHLGPEGNYLAEFGPYFTDRYRTPWGDAINFDGPGSDGVRRFVIDNALFWLTEYHVDALRLDAIHGIYDFSSFHVLAELAERFHEQAEALGRQAWLIAESDLNDVRVLQPRAAGGYGLDAQWHDEFHHALVSFLTKSDRGFLGSFGRLADIRKVLLEGFVYDGIYSPHRRRRFGSSSREVSGYRFVVFLQNHDQIANTSGGRRLSEVLPVELLKVAVTLMVCSPYLPLLFMGEEFAHCNPFLYFTSHTDPALARAVSEGRQHEYAEFAAEDDFFDPQSPDAFHTSAIEWSLLECERHRAIRHFYQGLIELRKNWPCLSNGRKDLLRVEVDEETLLLRMERGDPSGVAALLICNFGDSVAALRLPNPRSSWQLALSTKPPSEGAIAARSAVLFLSRGQDHLRG